MKSIATEETDQFLMERVRQDDADALARIVDRHWGPLVSFTTRIVGTVDAAEEVVQETFVRLWERRAQWVSSGSVRSYLFRTARNLGVGSLRHMAVRRRTASDVRMIFHDPPPSPLDEVTSEELRSTVWKALERLPPRRREALALVRLKGMSLDEAAEQMKLSHQTVANYVSLALDDLHEILRDYTE